MDGIKVHKSVHIEATCPDAPVQVADVAYASRDNNILLESLYSGVIRRSEDNGKTWSVVEEWAMEEFLGRDIVRERRPPIVFCDPDNGLMLRLISTNQHKRNTIAWDYAIALGPRTARLFTQVSKDEGLTWSEPEQVILQGDEYHEIHWMEDVYYGRNGAVVDGVHLIKNHGGSVLAPFYGAKLFGDDIINPDIAPAESNPDGNVEWVSGCLIGRWRSDGSGLDWSQSSPVTIPRKYSCDGADEPSVDYLPDGRLFMALRARTYPHTGQELPGLHYYSLSSDHGKTWSATEPLLYDDGSYPYSPACLANVFRSSKNGRFYVITNFVDVPPVNCDPRTKIQIAEIDTDTLRVKKETVTILDQQDKVAGQPDEIRFSNFRWYEDRETNDVVLYMTACAGNAGRSSECNVSPHAYRYDICLPA